MRKEMNDLIVFLLIGFIIIILIISFLINTYNQLVRLRNMVKDQWAQIDVLLKRRADLVPNLVETVKGYAKYEKETLESVITARNNAISAENIQQELESNNTLTHALSKLLVLSESYPELKANENFIELQKSLKETEDKIGFARQFYNDSVLNYKNKLEQFPSNLIASIFKFESKEFLTIDGQDRKVPNAQF